MSSTATRWSGRPRRPAAVAPPGQPGADASLVRGAVEYALGHLRASLRRHDLAAALLTDPANVRYASGTSVMPVWTMHAIDRYVLVTLGERLGRRLPAAYHAERYPFIAHGGGLGDEYPVIAFSDHHDGELEDGTVLSVEAYVGVEGEDEGLKLEEQVLVTSAGVQVLSHAPHDEYLSP